VLFSTDGGLFYCFDPTAENPEFQERSRLFNTLQYYACAIHPEAGKDYFLAGAQDNGTFRYSGEAIDMNDHVSGGDGAYCFIDEDEPHIQMSQSQFNTIYLSTDGNFNGLDDYFNGDFGTFINPCDYDSKLNTLYCNAADFYGNYRNIIVRIFNIGNGMNFNYSVFNSELSVPYSHIKVSPHAAEGTTNLYLGSQSGRIFKAENAHIDSTVTELTSNVFPTASVSSIDVGSSEDHLIASFSNYGVESVWLSNDGGNSWQSKQGNLPDMPVRWVLFQPQNDRRAIVATELGVWACDDLNQEDVIWQPTPEGFANVRVDMMRIRKSDNTVVAATHGRGLYSTIYNDMSPDAGILSINTPVVGNTYTATEEIEITVKNYGIIELNDIIVNYQLNDNEIISETISESIAGDSSLNYTFNNLIDLSEPTLHKLKVWTSFNEDIHNENDTVSIDIDNSSLSEELGLINFNLYPNPISDYFNISFTTLQKTDLEIKLIDASGKEVYKVEVDDIIGSYNKQINIDSNPGIHLLVLNNSENEIVKKIIIK